MVIGSNNKSGKSQSKKCKKCTCLSVGMIKNKSIKSTDKVLTVPQVELDKLNLYLRSIVSSKYLNFPAYGNKINLYFETTLTPQIAAYLNLNNFEEKPILTFDSVQQDSLKDSLRQTADLIGLSFNVVTNKSEANYIIFLIESFVNKTNGNANTFTTTTSPALLELYPEIFNDQLIIGFSKSILDIYNVYFIGSYFFSAALHSIGHTLGLEHPFNSQYDSTIMPGTSVEQQETNQGLFYMNNVLTTVMSFCNIVYKTNQIRYATQPRTFMTLDLQAINFYYKNSITQKYIDNWVDLGCSVSTVQTLVSTSNGITLDLVPSDFSEDNGINICLQSLSGNPMEDGLNSYGAISSRYIGYDIYGDPAIDSGQPADADLELYSASILAKDSFISKILNSYYDLEVQGNTIINNCEIVIKSKNCELVLIWLKCRQSYYSIEKTSTTYKITNKKTKKYILITGIFPKLKIEVGYSVNN